MKLQFKTSLLNLIMLLLGFGVLITSCKKNNDNDDKIETPVSRLFVSNADTDMAVANLSVYSPADGASLPAPTNLNAGFPDGNGVVYDAGSNIGFQVSRTNKAIKMFSVSDGGMVTLGNTFTDAGLVSGRDAVYDVVNKTLYVASNTDSTVRVYANAPSLSGSINANKVFKLNGQPWGLEFSNGRLMVLIDLNRKEIQVFNNVNNISAGQITPTSIITIPSATRLHGLVYSAASDVLIVTEIGAAAAPAIPNPTGPAFNADGGIYIIEGANAKFAANAAVTPTRTIIGSNTKLGNPVDVTFDGRAGKNLIYVAEKANKLISVFRLSDNGNVAPATSAMVTTLPESIFVDAR